MDDKLTYAFESRRLSRDWDDRLPWKFSAGGVTATEILRGNDGTGLVVVLAHAAAQPNKGDLQAAWRARSAGGVMPVLLAVMYPHGGQSRVALLGLDDDAVPALGVDFQVAEQLISDALVATSPAGMHAEVGRRLSSLSAGIAPGVRTEGLLASHVLDQQPGEPGWEELCALSRDLMTLRGEALLTAFGYLLEPVADGTVLREAAGQSRRAAVVLLAEGESFDNPLSRFHNVNAVTHGLAVARRENVDWLIVLGGSVIRLYPGDPDVGVGRKGQTQTYVEVDISILAEQRTGYLALLFAPDSLAKDGALSRLLSDSSRYAADLSGRLRERIYATVVRNLSVAVADRVGVASLPHARRRAALDEAYHQTMIILFRLLFVAYAEDRGLLPFEKSERYTRHALKTLARNLLQDEDQAFDSKSTTLWDDIEQVWKVIDTGDIGGWGIPAYNGGLFSRDPKTNPSGAATYGLELTNDQLGPVLQGLLLDVTADGRLGPVDFRSLSVREFGTIYEGLLESCLDIADTDLALDDDVYVIADAGDEVAVTPGQVYFHSRSGSRKATGSYFTKPFAVEHLLDQALEPAITGHLALVESMLKAGATKSAADALFDFRVADLAMGSGHFLVAAVDRVEARFSAFIAEHPMPEVTQELHHLRATASSQLGIPPGGSGIDDGVLLRRQIARRCIYGVDINEIAVELARLAIWIHTFVPGLPLSFLNHGLILGNSLTGLGTIKEIAQSLAEAEQRELKKPAGQGTVLDEVLSGFLDRAKEYLTALGDISDAVVADVAAAASAEAGIRRALEPLAGLCDLITAERATRHLGSEIVEEAVYDKHGRNPKIRKHRVPHRDRVVLAASPGLFTASDVDGMEQAILAHPHLERAKGISRELGASHFPVVFPEVFRREDPGFDSILGNPPWDKVRHEPQQFWVTASPGLNRLPDTERDARIESLRATRPMDAARESIEMASRAVQQEFFKAAFVMRGGTHVELAQLLLERAIGVSRVNGTMGLVLPRQFTVLAGWGRLRENLVTGWDLRIVQGRNRGEWIFDGIHASYAVALLSATRSDTPRVSLAVANGIEDVVAIDSAWIGLATEEIASLTDTYVLPWFSTRSDRDVFEIMRSAPSLSSAPGWITGHHDARWDFRGSGPDNALASRTEDGSAWRILMTSHVEQFAISESHKYKQFVRDLNGLIAKDRGVMLGASGTAMLSSSHPAIIVRHPSRSDDSRTLIASALPEAGILHNKGYVHAIALDQDTDPQSVLALLGYVNTVVADWWARRFVDRHVTAPVINRLALPAWSGEQVQQAASAVSTLLARHGFSTLPGGVAVADVDERSDTELLGFLNRLALDGFGLQAQHFAVISADFNETGLPSVLRAQITATFDTSLQEVA